MNETATHLRSTINTALPLLRSIPHATVRLDPYPPKWSKIQVLGHLVDSACNNHMKFTLAMAQPHTRVIGYAQNHWVDAQHYQDGDWNELVELWYAYNRHLAHVIARASPETLSHTLTIAGPKDDAGPFTLGFVMSDYIEHMKHHLLQILPDAPFTHRFQNVYGA